jgi:choline kinase
LQNQLSIIIPAAGMGRRMKSYGPKPLIELSERYTVIGRQQSILQKEYPSAEIIVVVGHESDKVMNHLGPNVKPIENENFETTNVVRSIAMGLRIASHPCVLIVYGDLVFNPAAIRIAGGQSVALVDSNKQIGEEEVGLTIVDGRITHFAYGLETKWAQIVCLTGRELGMFRTIVKNRDNGRWFGFEALNAVIGKGGSIRAVEPKNTRIAEIDTSKDIEIARRIL